MSPVSARAPDPGKIRTGSETLVNIVAFLQIERVNYFLHNIVKTARRGDEVGSRTVACLLGDPINGRLLLLLFNM